MYDTIANQNSIEKVLTALAERNFEGLVVDTKDQALAKIQELIPAGASVMNGASVTLEQIGYVDYVKSNAHPWNNLHAAIVAQKDPAQAALLRRQAVFADYYLGSAAVLTEQGELVFGSNTGSQLPALAFTSPNVVLVVGAQKIVANLEQALKRLEDYVVPLEDEHMKGLYGQGTMHAKTLILHRENPKYGRKVRVIIVKENLGF